MHLTFYICALIILVASGCNNSTQNVSLYNNENEVFSRRDSGLLCETYTAVLNELKITEEAKTRSAYRETKEFANTLYTDNKKLQDILIAYSQTQSIELPFDINENQKKKWKQLIKKKGKQFDQAFIQMIKDNQDESFNIFSTLSKESENQSLKQIGLNFIQISEKHKQMASSLAETFMEPNKTDSIQPKTSRK